MNTNVLNTDLTGKVAVVTGAGGVLCSVLAKVLARAGAKVALLNRTVEKAHRVKDDNPDLAARLVPAETLPAFVASLKAPRVVVVMVNAGAPVDEQIEHLVPLLSPGDILLVKASRAIAAERVIECMKKRKVRKMDVILVALAGALIEKAVGYVGDVVFDAAQPLLIQRIGARGDGLRL